MTTFSLSSVSRFCRRHTVKHGARRRFTARIAALSLSAASLSCAGAAEFEEPAGTSEEEIVNGSVQSQSAYLRYGLVAIYHRSWSGNLDGAWFSRPCSGKIIRSVGGVSVVLTARHCVTHNGSPEGTVLEPNHLRLVARRDPGPALPNPPSDAIAPSSVNAHAVLGDGDLPSGWNGGAKKATYDAALITVNADWSAHVQERHGYFLGDTSLLMGFQTYAYGYGINVNDQNCYGNSAVYEGAGIARRGGRFTFDEWGMWNGHRVAAYANSNSSGHQVICGDSGGPSIATIGSGDYRWDAQMGIHANGSSRLYVSLPASWLSYYVGFYVSPFSVKGRSMTNTNNNLGLTTGTGARLYYHAGDKRIVIGAGGTSPKCLTYTVGAPLPTWQACNTTSNQRWELHPDGKVTNHRAGSTRCLEEDGNYAYIRGCEADSANDATKAHQRWSWHPQP